MTTDRFVITTIDDILRMLMDYCGPEDIPADSVPLTLQHHSTERGKLSILIESPSLTRNDPLEVRFDLRKSFLL